MNKKGGLIGTSNTLALATVIIAIIMVISFFFITILGKPSGGIQAAEYSNKVQVRNALLTYLDTPVEVDGVKMKMVDLILIANIDKKYLDQLKEDTRGIFKDFSEELHFSVDIQGEGPINFLISPRVGTIKDSYKEEIKLPGNVLITFTITEFVK